MKGTIRLINNKRGMFAVEVDDGDYTIIELLCAGSPEVGDEIAGNLHNVAGEKIRNITQQEDWDVYIQDFHASRTVAIKMIS
jgi:hypothetical protein